jgi:hypothetical protein
MKGFNENHIETISENLSELADSVDRLASNPPVINIQSPPAVVVPAPVVDARHSVTMPEHPKRWVFEVTERDGIGRIRKLTATAI